MTDQAGTRTGPSPFTDAEQIRWQRQAAIVLTRLLELAAERGLPPVAWTVGAAGAQVNGECLALVHAARRQEFGAWREALGEPDTFRETELSGGEVRLIAAWDRSGRQDPASCPPLQDRDGWRLATVTLVASILPDLDEDEAAPLESAALAQLAAYVDQAGG